MTQYQVIAKVESFGKMEVLHHYEGSSLEAAMEDYQMDMSQVKRGRLDRVELLADGAVIRFMDKGGEDTEVSQEVESQEMVAEPVLATVYNNTPKGWKNVRFEAKSLEPGKTEDRYFGLFTSEAEAWKAIDAKHPQYKVVSHRELLDEQGRRLQAKGTSFAQESFLGR